MALNQINKVTFKYPKKECPVFDSEVAQTRGEHVACSTGLKATLNKVERVEGQYYFYILECSDNSLYCGSSSILSGRIKEHESGKAAKWTRERRPVQLVYFEVYDNHLIAQRREAQIKGWVKKKKENLLLGKWSKLRN